MKSALVLLLLGTGRRNRQRTLPALAHAARARAAPGPTGRVLRRTLRAEVASTGPFSAAADIGPARAELTVEPALAGANDVHLYLFDRAGGRQWDAARRLTVRASLPERDSVPITIEARKAGPDHYVIDAAPLAPAGEWTLELDARVSELAEHRATVRVPIR